MDNRYIYTRVIYGNNQNIVINGIEYVRKSDAQAEMAKNTEGLPYVIVRCKDAGVHAGYLVSRDDETLVLTQARRLWKYHGRTLSGLAIEGTDDASSCKFGDQIDITLNARDWCEIIPCTSAARKSLEGVERLIHSGYGYGSGSGSGEGSGSGCG